MRHDFDAALAAGKQLGSIRDLDDGGKFVVLGDGDTVHDLEHLATYPTRIRQTVSAHDVATFVAYVNAFKLSSTKVFADISKFSVTTVLDYHVSADLASWCSHRITYTAPRSNEWKTWTGSNRKAMTQTDFAQFIEDNVPDIRLPSGADLLEVSRNLQAKKSVEFASAIRLSNGEHEFTYNEMVSGTAGKNKLKVPEQFTLGIPVFVNDALYEMEARLRYRINDGKLQLWYDLLRQNTIEKDAFNRIVEEISTGTAIDVWNGVV